MSIDSKDQLERGLAAYADRDYDLAISELHDISLSDSEVALEYLSEALARKDWIANSKKVEKLRIMAASLGSELACIRLGEKYNDIQSELGKAEKYFQQAAEMGSNLARVRLANTYLNTGTAFERQTRLKMAADCGSADAMFQYAKLIELGGVVHLPFQARSPNPIKNWFENKEIRQKQAREWYLKAAFAGSAHVVGHLMGIDTSSLSYRATYPPSTLPPTVMKRLTPDRSIIEQQVKNGNPFAVSVKAFFSLHSKLYRHAGLLTKEAPEKPDIEQAVFWLRKAAELGNQYAMGHLGQLYKSGQGVRKNIERAFAWSLFAMQCDSKYVPIVEQYGLLMVDLEHQIELDLAKSIKRDPQKYCH